MNRLGAGRRASHELPTPNAARPQPPVSNCTSTRGFTVLEIVIATILLGAVLSMIVPLTKRAVEQRQHAATRRAAMIEVSNALERLTADPTALPSPGEQRELTLPDRLARRLREPQLVVHAVALDGDPAGRRLDASLTWQEPNGARRSAVRLSAFAFDATAEGGER